MFEYCVNLGFGKVYYLLCFMWTVMESIVALQPPEIYSMHRLLCWVMAVCRALCLFGLYVEQGASRA